MTLRFAIAGKADMAGCLAVREAVFCGEQGVRLDEEQDGHDPDCLHVIGRDDGVPVAALRVMPKGDWAKIQRVAVLPSHRGTGAGAALMLWTLAHPEAAGWAGAILGSQTHAMGFYERLGFAAEGDAYFDARIPHRDMRLAFARG